MMLNKQTAILVECGLKDFKSYHLSDEKINEHISFANQYHCKSPVTAFFFFLFRNKYINLIKNK